MCLPQAAHLRCYATNLDRSKDRCASLQTAYAASDLASTLLVRVPAVDGSALNQSDLEALLTPNALHEVQRIDTTGYRQAHFEATRGAIGCYLTHMHALERVATQSEQYALIFEDDANLPSNAFALVERALACAGDPASWDMLVFNCECLLCQHYPTSARQCQGLHKVQHFSKTHTYIVTPRSAATILSLLQAQKISQQVDLQLSCLASAGKVNILCDTSAGRGRMFKQLNDVFKTQIQVKLAARGFTPIKPRCAE